MDTQRIVTTGRPVRIQRMEALAFHDASGRIRHMHHRVVLEGAEPRPDRAVLDEAKAQALALGTDVSKLRVLHVKEPFNLGSQHKVDVKKGTLVELKPPKRSLERRPAPRSRKR